MTLKLNLRHWQSVSQVDDDEKVNWIIRRSVFVLRRHCHAILIYSITKINPIFDTFGKKMIVIASK